jgi:hypothetical protein
MSQKTNPISFRLGLSQVWNASIASYGKSFTFYQKNNLENYLKYLFTSEGLHLGKILWSFDSKRILLIITYLEFPRTSNKQKHLTNKLNKNLFSLFKLPLKVYLFKHSIWSSSSEFIKSYISTNVNESISLKQILRSVSKIISVQLKTKKVVYTCKGPLTLKLKGFKIKSSGRFANSRNQMSKTIKHSGGCLPLPKINSHVEYTQSAIYTKLGICSLHIWLVYSY